jgi:group II intron reverse transcriptase/maturase
MVFTTLAHLMDVEFLGEAYRLTRKDSAAGVDGVTAREYAENLDENLRSLHERLRSGRYKAPPVERAWLEKADGGKRPIGKPTFEDKIVQRAVVMLLGAIYEQEFYGFSYGFREGRSAHQALGELRHECERMNIGWIVDADVSGCFDNLDHGQLRAFIKQRINDGGILRLIGKWLNAGVLEEGILAYPDRGTPQGGVISPMLANVFLHHVLDEWFVEQVRPRMKGRCFLIRFADDFVIGCELEADARRILEVLPKRFGRFGLTIHSEKTALIRFRRPESGGESGGGNGTFDFLGFTHYWATSRRGSWVIKRRTARKRLRRAKKSLWQWCRGNRHRPLREQHRVLCHKLRGHFQYYAIRGNSWRLEAIFMHTKKAWRYWLSRRSNKSYISWEKFERVLLTYPLPRPRILHGI